MLVESRLAEKIEKAFESEAAKNKEGDNPDESRKAIAKAIAKAVVEEVKAAQLIPQLVAGNVPVTGQILIQ